MRLDDGGGSVRVGLFPPSRLAGWRLAVFQFGYAPAVEWLDDAGRGVRLLLSEDAAVAQSLAEELDRDNQARQEIERRILAEAVEDAAERVAGGDLAFSIAIDKARLSPLPRAKP